MFFFQRPFLLRGSITTVNYGYKTPVQCFWGGLVLMKFLLKKLRGGLQRFLSNIDSDIVVQTAPQSCEATFSYSSRVAMTHRKSGHIFGTVKLPSSNEILQLKFALGCNCFGFLYCWVFFVS